MVRRSLFLFLEGSIVFRRVDIELVRWLLGTERSSFLDRFPGPAQTSSLRRGDRSSQTAGRESESDEEDVELHVERRGGGENVGQGDSPRRTREASFIATRVRLMAVSEDDGHRQV